MPQNFSETERTLEDFVNQVWHDHPPKTRKEQHEAEVNRSRLTLQKFKQEDAGPTAADINISKSRRSLNNKSSQGKVMTLINEEEFKPSDVFQTEHVLPNEPNGGSAGLANDPTQVDTQPAGLSTDASKQPTSADNPAPSAGETPPAPAAAPPPAKKGIFSLFGKKKK
jgi:hypothetical protein